PPDARCRAARANRIGRPRARADTLRLVGRGRHTRRGAEARRPGTGSRRAHGFPCRSHRACRSASLRPVVMRVSVFGLGYVGCVSAASLAADGHEVIGVDVNADKVAAVNAGRSPIVEPGLDELLSRSVAQGQLRATVDTADAIHDSEVSLLCVGTPSHRNGSLDLTYLQRVSEQIGDALKHKPAYHVVVVRSTVL